jgi:prepilin-type N-terminal cleavage/methylation domain-containing protein
MVAALLDTQADSFEGAIMTSRTTMARSGSTGKTQGFTLIELLIVVVIIGILAAIAIPKFANTKEKAVVASMKSDLRNLASSQEAYWVDNRTYYLGALPGAGIQYQSSPGVTVTIVDATGAGWSARATGLPLTTVQCVIFYGTTPPIPPATADAAVACS